MNTIPQKVRVDCMLGIVPQVLPDTKRHPSYSAGAAMREVMSVARRFFFAAALIVTQTAIPAMRWAGFVFVTIVFSPVIALSWLAVVVDRRRCICTPVRNHTIDTNAWIAEMESFDRF